MGASQVRSKRRHGLLSSAEAAVALGICERTLRRYIQSDRIRYRRLPGGHYRIPAEAIPEFWAESDRRKQARPTSSRPRVAARSTSRRRPVPELERDEEYDLSPEHLAEVRAQLAGTQTI